MKHLLIKAIDLATENLKIKLKTEEGDNRLDLMWDIRKYEDLKVYLEKLAVINSQDLLMKGGGKWLGNVRNWMQRKAHNGENVTWGSNEYLKLKELTVSDMEQLATQIAASAIKESMDHQFSFLKP